LRLPYSACESGCGKNIPGIGRPAEGVCDSHPTGGNIDNSERTGSVERAIVEVSWFFALPRVRLSAWIE